MRVQIKTIFLTTALSTLAVAPLAMSFTLASPTAAEAEAGGNGGGNGASNGGGNGGGNGHGGSNHSGNGGRKADNAGIAGGKAGTHGALASELKGLNAAHANPNAFANADPDSQVGRIGAYAEAARSTQQAETLVTEAQARLNQTADSYDGRTSADVEADIAALDPASADYATQLAGLEAERTDAVRQEADLAELEAGLVALEAQRAIAEQVEADKLLTASDGRVLSVEALAELRALLQL